MRHLVFQVKVVRVVQQKTIGLVVNVVSQVHVFIVLANFLETAEPIDHVGFVGKLESQVHFHLPQEWLRFLHEEVEVCDVSGKNVACARVKVRFVDACSLPHALIGLTGSHLGK